MYASYLAGNDEFVYPAFIARDDFADKADFDPDSFLYDNHRFTSLDSLHKDLQHLSQSLNQNLLDLVNNEYSLFIQLGQSISGCLDLIDNISLDVRKFDQQLRSAKVNLTESSAAAERALQHKRRLNVLKNKAKLILLLNELCLSFEMLLGLEIGELSPEQLKPKLSTLATLYLSATKIFAILTESNGDEKSCVFFDKVLKTKLLSLQLEYKAYIHETLKRVKAEPKDYSHVIMMLLHCKRIVGSLSDGK